MRRALHLATTLESFPGVRTFTVGKDDVTSIEAADAGAYDVHIGPKLVRVPAHKVDHYEQDPRPGYEREQANRVKTLPSYVRDFHDGAFGCVHCPSKFFESVHAVQVHFGIQHGDQRT